MTLLSWPTFILNRSFIRNHVLLGLGGVFKVFQLSNNPGLVGFDVLFFIVRITNPGLADSGVYECQINTEPKRSRLYHLDVVISKARKWFTMRVVRSEPSQLVSGQDTRGPGRLRPGGQRHQPHLHRPLQPRAATVSQVETQQPRPPQVNQGRHRHRHGEEEEDLCPAHVQVSPPGAAGGVKSHLL